MTNYIKIPQSGGFQAARIIYMIILILEALGLVVSIIIGTLGILAAETSEGKVTESPLNVDLSDASRTFGLDNVKGQLTDDEEKVVKVVVTVLVAYFVINILVTITNQVVGWISVTKCHPSPLRAAIITSSFVLLCNIWSVCMLNLFSIVSILITITEIVCVSTMYVRVKAENSETAV